MDLANSDGTGARRGLVFYILCVRLSARLRFLALKQVDYAIHSAWKSTCEYERVHRHEQHWFKIVSAKIRPCLPKPNVKRASSASIPAWSGRGGMLRGSAPSCRLPTMTRPR